MKGGKIEYELMCFEMETRKRTLGISELAALGFRADYAIEKYRRFVMIEIPGKIHVVGREGSGAG